MIKEAKSGIDAATSELEAYLQTGGAFSDRRVLSGARDRFSYSELVHALSNLLTDRKIEIVSETATETIYRRKG